MTMPWFRESIHRVSVKGAPIPASDFLLSVIADVEEQCLTGLHAQLPAHIGRQENTTIRLELDLDGCHDIAEPVRNATI